MLRATVILAAILIGWLPQSGWSQTLQASAGGTRQDSASSDVHSAEKTPVPPAATPVVHVIDSSQLRDGDIVLRRGRGLLSMLFSAVGPGDHEFSHGGIFLRRDGRDLIIHTVANQITGKGAPKIEPLSSFIDKDHARSAAAYRVKGLDEPTRKRFLETALSYVRDKVPFDDKFDLADASKLYCTELIYRALLTAGVAVVASPHKLTAPVGGLLIGEIITAGQIAMSERTEFVVRLK